MKKLVVALLAAFVLSIFGCGPSQEQKKTMDDLTAEVTNMVNNTNASLNKLDDLSGQVQSAISNADTLAKKFPKDTISIASAVTQLKSAKDRLMSVKENVTAWIGAYKIPDMENMKFDEVMSSLKKSKDDLSSATQEVEGALNAATAALDGYKNMATELAAKLALRKK